MFPPQGTRGIGGVGGGRSLRTATRIVAASNSLDKSSADYICDGVHDEEEINKAISDLVDVGGTVLLLEGTYNIGSAGTKVIEFEEYQIELPYGIYITSNVRLIGQGKSTVLVLDINNFNAEEYSLNTLILSDSQSVEVSDLVIDGSFSSLPIALIFLFNVGNSSVLNCTIQHSFYGIFIFDSNNCTIANNIINGISFYGIYTFEANNCIISGNVCNNNGGGIALYFSNRNIISDNECYNSTYNTGIEVFNSSNNYIGGNVCISNEYGIYIDMNSSSNVVCSNVLYMNRMDGICIVANDNLISENIITGNFVNGIYLRGGSYNTTSCNVVRCMGIQSYGIYVSGTGNLIISNDLYQAGKTTDFYDEGSGTVYHNNRITNRWIS
jgi:parallel beta-helix repeat protein